MPHPAKLKSRRSTDSSQSSPGTSYGIDATKQSSRPMTDAAAQVQKLLRQQAAIARFGSFALRERDLTKILSEAVRACAEGLDVPFSKVCRYRAEENDLLVVAGHGWQDGVIGHAVSCADMTFAAGTRLHHRAAIHHRRFAKGRRLRSAAVLCRARHRLDRRRRHQGRRRPAIWHPRDRQRPAARLRPARHRFSRPLSPMCWPRRSRPPPAAQPCRLPSTG